MENDTFLNFNLSPEVSSPLLYISVFVRVTICIWAAECPLCVYVGNMLMSVLSCQPLKGERNDRAVDIMKILP